MTSTELMNVSAFENAVPSSAFATLNPADESLADGIGSSYAIIGYKGKVWTLRHRGEHYTFVRPDDGSPAAFLDVIVLRSAPYKSKSYYPAGSFNDDNSAGARPVCASIDGVNPDNDVQQKQAAACAICPRNEWRTNAEGRKGRDCSDFKRLSVLLLPNVTKALLGAPLMEPVFLRVPAASLNDLAILGEAMQKKGFHYSSFITRIGFQPDKAHPQMTFKALQPLSDKEAAIVLPMREDVQAFRITGENEVGKSQGNVQQLQPATRPSTSTPTSQTSVQSSPVRETTKVHSTPSPSSSPSTAPEDDEEAALLKQLAAAKAKKAAQQKTAEAAAAKTADTGFGEIIEPAKVASQVDTGFGGLGETQPVVEVAPDNSGLGAAGAAQSMANTAEDTGPAEDADADLDARVAALLK